MLSRAGMMLAGLCLLGTGSLIAAPSPQAMRDAADDILTLLVKQDYATAAARFHYPLDYSAAELNQDRYHVEHNLIDMAREFGAVEGGRWFSGYALIRELGTSSGDYAYWQGHAEAYTVRYRVRFADVGDGFVKIQLFDSAGRLEVRAVAFGIADGPDTEQRITAIRKRLIQSRADRDLRQHLSEL